MDIETKNASLSTLSVTIQALHVSGKQMTLAVFRQLPIARAYNDDGSLAPFEFWGIVRYTIKDAGELWVICASSGRLYRCPLRWHGDSVERAESWCRNARAIVDWWKATANAKILNRYAYITCPCDAPKWTADGLDDLEAKVKDADNHLMNCKRADATRVELSKLPQLFIAV